MDSDSTQTKKDKEMNKPLSLLIIPLFETYIAWVWVWMSNVDMYLDVQSFTTQILEYEDSVIKDPKKGHGYSNMTWY